VKKAAKAVNVHDAKTHFSRLLARVEKGQEIVIARAGKPVARPVPNIPEPGPPIFGADRGAFIVPDDFDSPLPDEILDAFEGTRR
jgi:prevent-host-death family protein